MFIGCCKGNRGFTTCAARYSLTPRNWGGLSRSKFTVSVLSCSIAVQPSDNISEIWSSIILFRGEIAIIQLFDEDISFFGHSKESKDHALAKTCWQNCHNISPMKKTVNCHFLFRLQHNCPVFQSNIQDRNAPVNASLTIVVYYVGR